MSGPQTAGEIARPAPPVQLPEGLVTPVPVVDVDALDRNVTAMAAAMRDRGVGLRPHTKTSKCREVVQRQIDAGVVGLTVATLGEAEVLVAAGFTQLFQAYPLWAGVPEQARRLRVLHDSCELVVGVESAESAAALGRAVAGAGHPLQVAVELDPGMHRTGVDVVDCVTVARACADVGLDVVGAFTFGGHAYAGCDAPAGAADDEVRVLDEAAQLLGRAGFDVRMLSAGSTPTALRSARPPVTDERPGTYVFQDCQQVALGSAAPDSIALVVAATVVATHAGGRFVLDAGSKVLGSDRPVWLPGFGAVAEHPEAVLRSLSEHHAVGWTTGPLPAVGSVVRVVPNHCCIVVNLADELTVVSGGEVVDHWRVIGRGRNS